MPRPRKVVLSSISFEASLVKSEICRSRRHELFAFSRPRTSRLVKLFPTSSRITHLVVLGLLENRGGPNKLLAALNLSCNSKLQQIMTGEAYISPKAPRRRTPEDEGRWGNLTSLYDDLNPQQVELVEAAIRSCSFGDFEAGRRIFEQELPSAPFIPIIALEHATCYAFWGAFSLEAERLAQALSVIQKNQLDVLPEVQWLFRIRLALARYESEGTLRLALQEARSLRAWLIDVNILDHSDVMVSFSCPAHSGFPDMVIGSVCCFLSAHYRGY